MKRNRNEQQLTPEQINLMATAIQNGKDAVCKCGCMIFTEGAKIKILSKILTGAERNVPFPIPVIYCVKCQTELTAEEEAVNADNQIMLDFSKK